MSSSDLRPKLCESCSTFDVHALLLSAEKQPTTKTRRSGDLIRLGLKDYFQQHANLVDLRNCADSCSCELCRALWKSYCVTANLDRHTSEDVKLLQGLGKQPIYLGTADQIVSRESLAHVVAVQSDPSFPALSRQLACFEVCIAHGKPVTIAQRTEC